MNSESASKAKFESEIEKVREQLNDPAFRESVNQAVIIDSYMSGQQPYKKSYIDQMNDLVEETRKMGFSSQDNYYSNQIAINLLERTENFSQDGSYRMEGESVRKLVDIFLYTAYEEGLSTDRLADFAEVLIASGLGIYMDKPFDTYQIDITLSGQGFVDETYFMDIQFRPIPKNVYIDVVRVPGRGVEPPRL